MVRIGDGLIAIRFQDEQIEGTILAVTERILCSTTSSRMIISRLFHMTTYAVMVLEFQSLFYELISHQESNVRIQTFVYTIYTQDLPE
jgi:hypothetical protein